jgi:hypothetical protein
LENQVEVSVKGKKEVTEIPAEIQRIPIISIIPSGIGLKRRHRLQ